MKITGLRVVRHYINYKPRFACGERTSRPLDVYEEYNYTAEFFEKGDAPEKERSADFLVITTDEGLEGIHGPIEYRAQLITAVEGLSEHIIGRDPLENRMIWDIMSRFERHARSGIMMMAISAIDIALWDLKGKILGQPVYKLLGGGRKRLRPYASTLGFSVEPDIAKRLALEVKAMGIRAQKWFFRYGPGDGQEGMRKNLNLAFALREALGEDYELMFDCWTGWSVSYANRMFKELEAVRPMWVEEVLRPQMTDAYRRLRGLSPVTLSAGEHLYTRMEVNTYLREGIFGVMQSDPDWCGGITEALRIGDLCEIYGVTFIPHGHSLMSAMHIVASMPPDICPYVEYLLEFLDYKEHYFKHKRLGADGFLTINEEPGLGYELDFEKIIKSEDVTNRYI